jgi:DNA invertase Pin-like site-specific DNA recombinase
VRLPCSLDDLTGLRAARWVRESTRGQADRFGPDAQREQQDRAIELYGLADTGLAWTVAHSGRTVGTTGQFAEMLAAAGREYDVLVVGYVSRFARDLRTAVNARHDLHAAGAVLLFADERVLSSDEESWEQWAREAVEAEAYSRRLGKRIREGYAAKFRRLGDQAGNAPLGFLRSGPQATLTIDLATMPTVIRLFERYASGVISIEQLAAVEGLAVERVAKIIRNPVYNGWAVRRGERSPAPWRADPPIPDDLWERVAELRGRRRRRGGGNRRTHADPLAGLVECVCGSPIRAHGTVRGKHRRRHTRPDCPAGMQRTVESAVWAVPIETQVGGLRLSDATIAAIVRVLSEPETPALPFDAARADRRRRELALDYAAGRLDETAFLAGVAALRVADPEPAPPTVAADRAIGYLRALAETWAKGTPEERSEVVAAVYERIVVQGPEFVGVRLTPAAYAHGLALALPERVSLASPAGDEAAGAIRIPIEGAAEWRRAARRSA